MSIDKFILDFFIGYSVMLGKNKMLFLPTIDKRYSLSRKDSALSRLSSELSTIQIKNEQLDKKKDTPQKLMKKRIITEPYEHNQLREFKGEIKELKSMIAQKNLEKSLLIEDRLRKLARLSTKQLAKPYDSPRSAVNYISLSPQSHSPAPLYPQYPSYPYPYPPAPSYPYMQGTPPYMNPPPPHPYYGHPDYERQGHYRPRTKMRKRQRESQQRIPYERNYDEYQQPTRYKKMKQTQRGNKKANVLFLKKLKQKLIKKWRAAVWAIVFSLSLITYCKKIVDLRQSLFNKFQKRNFNIEMTMLTKYIVKKCKPFFIYIANKKQFQLTIQDGQTERMQNQKAQLSKRLITMLIQGLNSIKIDDTNQPSSNPAQLIHMFCKHGSFVVNQFMTEEQLDMVSFSEKNKYLRLDRNLQISQIINFICTKILLYNAILNPSNVDAKLFPIDNEIINKNFYFFGSIWYDLCLELQDQYLCQVPNEYQIGNWRKFREKYDIKPAKSLTANGEPKEEDQLISGMIDKLKIEQAFGKNFWRKEKLALKNALENIHQVIVNFHRKLVQKIKF